MHVCNFTFQAQKRSVKENFNVKEKNDNRFLQEKHNRNVCDSNVQECTVENREMEKDLGSEKHGITERGNGSSACTEEWRDWSLQLTRRSRLIITGKADK